MLLIYSHIIFTAVFRYDIFYTTELENGNLFRYCTALRIDNAPLSVVVEFIGSGLKIVLQTVLKSHVSST
jgi:hypothetical protein